MAMDGRRRLRPAGEPLVQYVDPFIGTGGHGHTFPGRRRCPAAWCSSARIPGKQGWDWCAGYHYSDTEIAGFSHTHLSGTGIGDLCDILVTPTLAGAEMPGTVTSPFSHEQGEGVGRLLLGRPAGVRHPGRADGHAPRRRATGTRSSGRLPAASRPCRSTSASPSTGTSRSTRRSRIEGPTTISGYRFSTGWAKDQRVFFVARFSTPFQTWLVGDAEGLLGRAAGRCRRRARAACSGSSCGPGEPLLVKVAISPVSVDGARKNLEREAPGLGVRRLPQGRRRRAWERKLQRVRIETPDKARKTVFYTALYHALLAPTTFCDVDRQLPRRRRRRPAAGGVPEPHRVLAVGHVPGAAPADDARAGRSAWTISCSR